MAKTWRGIKIDKWKLEQHACEDYLDCTGNNLWDEPFPTHPTLKFKCGICDRELEIVVASVNWTDSNG